MPRPPRLDYEHARHHVMNRGARRAPIFHSDDDCQAFLDLLAELPTRFGAKVHGWALMGNHFHLLLSTPRANLAEALGWLQSRYSRRQNLLHRWDGPLFRGRYKNRLVEDDDYWRHLLAYLHLNPVRAHLVGRAEQARWTSHRAYLGLDPAPDWLDRAELLALFGGPGALAEHVRDLQVGRESAPCGFDPDQLWEADTSLGDDPPMESPLRSVEQAIVEVVVISGLPREELMNPGRGRRGNPARWLLAWWLADRAGLGTSAIAEALGTDPSTITRLLGRARGSLPEPMAGWQERLRELSVGEAGAAK